MEVNPLKKERGHPRGRVIKNGGACSLVPTLWNASVNVQLQTLGDRQRVQLGNAITTTTIDKGRHNGSDG